MKICLEGNLPVPACCRTICALSTVNPTAFLPALSSRLLGTQQGKSLGMEESPNQEGRIGTCRGCRRLLGTTHLTEHSCSSSWWVCCQSYGSSLITYAPTAYAGRLLLAEWGPGVEELFR